MPVATPFFIAVPHGNQAYLIFFRYPEDRPPGGRTRIAVDPYSGNVLMVIDSRRAPAGYRLVNLNRALHTGDVLGSPRQSSGIAGQSDNLSTADGIGNVGETEANRGD